MFRARWGVWFALVGCLAVGACRFTSALPHGDLDLRCMSDECEQTPTVRALAEDIDSVERLIERDGSVVAKTPSVWGEARLAKHRREYEEQMAAQLTTFADSLQGYIARSDQAYLAEALSLASAAAPGQGASNNAQTLIPVVAPVTAPSGTTTPAATQTNVFQTPPFGFSNLSGLTFLDSSKKVTLEPAVHLDQMSRFLNHLQELRRINEGDDTADAPGYSLNLVRVPVSILPGRHTRRGHGAEITMTVTPQYGEELLPRTFRNLVMNDVKDLLGVPVFVIANTYRTLDQNADETISPGVGTARKVYTFKNLAQKSPAVQQMVKHLTGMPGDAAQVDVSHPLVRERMMIQAAKGQVHQAPTTINRRNRAPLSPTQVLPVIGDEAIDQIAHVLSADKNRHDHLMLDVFKFLGAELEPAYDVVSQPHMVQAWWATPGPHELALAIQRNDLAAVEAARGAFLTLIATPRPISPVTAGLAWAVAVESALLNERLNEDLHETAARRKCPCPSGEWLAFYGPNPPPEARKAFVEYVQCRWPIHVFALDPVTQDENLADVFSRRRETQLALSLAFVTGQISTSSFTRYARRLETDMSTIALHRTAAGFVHGDRHFGWRFAPRFQTPPFEGNLMTIVRDNIIGGPSSDADLLKAQIEPGLRECVAVVIMPSIVSEITIDTSSRWYKLTNTKHEEPSVARTVELSEAIKRMQTCAANVVDACRYRDGEVDRLLRRVDQLGAELALQTLHQQVPIENTLGGYAMFNSGMTDLAPQLYGYYGEPGVTPGRENVIFLVGDHFSVHETQVLAGNRTCRFQMLSRRVLQVTLPSDLNLTQDDAGHPVVDLHVATPYGVTGHVQVHYEPGPHLPKTTFTWAATPSYAVDYTVKTTTATPPATVAVLPTVLPFSGEYVVATPDAFATPSAAKLRLTLLRDGQILAVADDIDLIYEQATHRLFARGATLAKADAALVTALTTHVQNAGFPLAPTYELRGQLLLNGLSLHTVEGSMTVTLRKK